MARKDQLRQQRAGTVINVTSAKQETEVIKALEMVVENLVEQYGATIELEHTKQWYLKDIVEELRDTFPDVDFDYHFDRSHIMPDGGFLFLKGKEDDKIRFPILISEVKNQGTNDMRKQEGKPKQARGNAIERLGKNLIGLRTALFREDIFPFVCFGYGCDFEDDSSILDRVTTMAMFGKLNKTYLFSQGSDRFDRGSFYFREQRWTVAEMYEVMNDIAERSILYYFAKYKKEHFIK